MDPSTISAAMRYIVVCLAALILLAILYCGALITPNLNELSSLRTTIADLRLEIAQSRQERRKVEAELDEARESLREIPEEVARSLKLLEQITVARQPGLTDQVASERIKQLVLHYAAETLAGTPTNDVVGQVYTDESQTAKYSGAEKTLLQAAAVFVDSTSNEAPDLSSSIRVLRSAGSKEDRALLDSAEIGLRFRTYEKVGWPADPSAALPVRDDTAFHEAIGVSKRLSTAEPLIWLGNYERRAGDASHAYSAFNAAVNIIGSGKADFGDAYDAFHGRGTELLALSISTGDATQMKQSMSDLRKAVFYRRREGQSIVSVNGSRENEGLVLLAERDAQGALELSEDIATVNNLPWNTVVGCLSAETLRARTDLIACYSTLPTYHRRDFHEKELFTLLPATYRRETYNLLNRTMQR